CYGLLVRPGPQQADQMWLRFVAGRPVSAVTIEFLAWCSARLAAQGFTALLLIWDNASWHRSHAVRHWVRQHNRQVQQGTVGVRIVGCQVPSKSPWLNPIEWSKKRGHLLLQTRVRKLNGQLGAHFKRWYPDMDLEVEEISVAA